MRDFGGKRKAVTFSFDDGVTQDRRLAALLNRYGLKATFNLNSGVFGQRGMTRKGGRCTTHDKIEPEEVASLYRGHEVAAHTLTHPNLTKLDDAEVVRQVEEDRLALESLCGQAVVGFAYPYGADDDRIVRLLCRHTGVRYARTVRSTGGFGLPGEPLRLDPTAYAVEYDRLDALGEAFIAMQTEAPRLFYVWGHSYEFDFDDGWARFERFCERIAGRPDIAYLTNREAVLPPTGDRPDA